MGILIQPSHIITALSATSKNEVLAEMAGLLVDFDHDALLAALLDREAVGATAIDPGLAVPHAKLSGAKEMQVCFARSRTGLQWGAPDHQLVHLIFLLVAPMDSSDQYLQTLATLCRFLRDSNNRNLLLSSSDKEVASIFAAAKELQ
ncbi:MAG: PTS sugar transporter subunit IIA [Thermodesulfobacteriota bacterium]